ncbi:Hypothetical predicted protein [Pelobates cultripes]|uniref:Zona pellucida sperm-binding protein 4-like n=1 Tax=Pelobates cultripes TaxID=61616 RepID=A0AAD1QXT9_PELCU|nr:Hypothetical predicted protein [Pelobates cultripes]
MLSPQNLLTEADHKGKLKPIVGDPSCGIWVTPGSDGFLFIDVDYDGCFIKKMDNYYTMTILMQHNITGKWEVYQKEDLRCPVFQAMDAPALNKCSGVLRGNRIACAGPLTSQDVCLQNGCCYDQSDSINPCYYGDEVTAQCSIDGQMSIAISKDVTLPPLRLDSVHLLSGGGDGCSPVTQNEAFIVFKFPLSACGTIRKINNGIVVYENDLIADQDVRTWSGALITRDSTFRLRIRCSFTASASEPLYVEVYTLPPPSPVSSTGPLTLQMRIAKDDRTNNLQFGQYYGTGDYPVVKYLRDPVFVEVRILNRNDPSLVLILEQCWATPSESPLQQPQWPILVTRCPFDGDNYKTQLLSTERNSAVDFPYYYKRFILSTFTFVGGTSNQAFDGLVYLHCSASACFPSSSDSCTATCNSRKRAVDDLDESTLTLVSSEGPILLSEINNELLVKKEIPHRTSGLEWRLIAAMVFLFSAILVGFLIGVMSYQCTQNRSNIQNLKV